MKTMVTVLLLALTAAVAPIGRAQDANADVMDMQALRAAVKADKRAWVAATLALTPAEAKKFWPLYDAYQRDLNLFNRRRILALEGLIARDRPVTDLYAKNLANELIATDEGEIKARRSLSNKLLRALPATKAARYMQLEFKVRSVVDYDIAAGIPLIH